MTVIRRLIFGKIFLNGGIVSLISIYPIYSYEIIFGITNENEETIIRFYNYIILHVQYYIHIQKKFESRSLWSIIKYPTQPDP